MSVYFICAADGSNDDGVGSVKIGTTIDVPRRLGQLQSVYRMKLKVLRIVPGGYAIEAWLHRRFSSLRTHGEWFKFSQEMLTIEPPTLPDIEADGVTPGGIIERLGGPVAVARYCGAPITTVKNWRDRQSIPARYHRALLNMAKDDGVDLTADQIADAHDPAQAVA
jgi:hypothetical protein